MGTVSHREDELGADEKNTSVAQDGENVQAHGMTKRINSWIGEGAGYEVEGEVKVGKREIGKEKIDKLIHKLDMKEDLSSDRVVRLPYLAKVDKRIDCREECAVQPSSSLRHKFRYRIC